MRLTPARAARLGKVFCSGAFDLFEGIALAHAVHEVIRNVDIFQCGVERLRLEYIGGRKLHIRPAARRQYLAAARDSAHTHATLDQPWYQVRPDVTTCAYNGDARRGGR
jgi:hypothetical protein